MIAYEEFYLDNGLQVVCHQDKDNPIAVLNILYKVGSRNETVDKTGFAHLFEHLMFGGSVNVENFDEEIERVGGNVNAFTSPDLTNYYISLPAVNLETAFWLESDRMLGLSKNRKVLEIQRKVVIEEFNQRYLNQPYGDVWLKLRPLAYEVHPYQWPTIGKKIEHIQDATPEDVAAFFYKYYAPNNAVLVIGSPFESEKIKKWADKWFGGIQPGNAVNDIIQPEPAQTAHRSLEHIAKVPNDMIYKAWHIGAKKDDLYFATDTLSDLAGNDKSSRLFNKLVREEKLFTKINAYHTGSYDPGLFVVSGTLSNGVDFDSAEQAIDTVMKSFVTKPADEYEVSKSKNVNESALAFNNTELLNRCMALAFAGFAGDISLVNKDVEKMMSVSPDEVKLAAERFIKPENSSTLRYKAE